MLIISMKGMTIMTNKDYSKMVKQASPNSSVFKDCFNAFWVGGLICTIGQIIFEFSVTKFIFITLI